MSSLASAVLFPQKAIPTYGIDDVLGCFEAARKTCRLKMETVRIAMSKAGMRYFLACLNLLMLNLAMEASLMFCDITLQKHVIP